MTTDELESPDSRQHATSAGGLDAEPSVHADSTPDIESFPRAMAAIAGAIAAVAVIGAMSNQYFVADLSRGLLAWLRVTKSSSGYASTATTPSHASALPAARNNAGLPPSSATRNPQAGGQNDWTGHVAKAEPAVVESDIAGDATREGGVRRPDVWVADCCPPLSFRRDTTAATGTP